MNATATKRKRAFKHRLGRRPHIRLIWNDLNRQSSNTSSRAIVHSLGTISTPTKFLPKEIRVETTNWLIQATKVIKDLCDERSDWGAASQLAEDTLFVLDDMDLRPDRIIPSSENGISFYFFRENGYALIECLASNEITALTKDEVLGRRSVWEVEPSTETIRDTASSIRDFLSQQTHENPPPSPRSA